MGSLHAVSDGSFTPSSSPDVMHPRDWVMAQTGLSAAMRDALSVLVAAYGGLQQKNGEFFVLESRVDPHLRTGFRTFKNYLSKLRKLGLLEMLSRGPNQYGPKTRWRMRLDVFCQSAQMSMNLPVTYETPEELNDGDGGESVTERRSTSNRFTANRRTASTTISRTPVPGMIAIEEINLQLRLLEEKYMGRVTELEGIVNDQGNRIAGLIEEVWILRGRAGSADGGQVGSDRQELGDFLERGGGGIGEVGAVEVDNWEPQLVDALSSVLSEIGKEPLTRHHKKRLRRAERLWKSNQGEVAVPDTFIAYAVAEAHEKKVRRFAGYMVSIIERRVKEAGNEEIKADEDAAVRGYLRKKGLAANSRY